MLKQGAVKNQGGLPPVIFGARRPACSLRCARRGPQASAAGRRGGPTSELACLECAKGSPFACAKGSLFACAKGSLFACAKGSLFACAKGSLFACAKGSLFASKRRHLDEK